MTNDGTVTTRSDNAISYEPRVVAFLDILGFRSFVSAGHDDAVRTIKAIDDALDHSLKFIREQDHEGWVSIRTFSDCLCLSTFELYLPALVDAVAFLQWYLAVNDIFVRGGISAGYHCETDRMIFSQGLVHAYELQTHDPYPRVVIAPGLAKKMMPMSYSTDWGASGSLAEYMLLDGEDVCFLDYLNAIVVASGLSGDNELFEQHTQTVRRQLALHLKNEPVYRKHLWLSQYHNFRAREAFSDELDWDPESYKEIMQELLIVPPKPCNEDMARHVCFKRPQREAAKDHGVITK